MYIYISIVDNYIVIIHNSWYFAHGVKCPRIIKSCKANGILNIALLERRSTTETDRQRERSPRCCSSLCTPLASIHSSASDSLTICHV